MMVQHYLPDMITCHIIVFQQGNISLFCYVVWRTDFNVAKSFCEVTALTLWSKKLMYQIFVKSVPTSQKTVSLHYKEQTLFLQIITVYSEKHTELINVFCVWNVIFSGKGGGTYIYHCASEGWIMISLIFVTDLVKIVWGKCFQFLLFKIFNLTEIQN
jgi:hypothetical protein